MLALFLWFNSQRRSNTVTCQSSVSTEPLREFLSGSAKIWSFGGDILLLGTSETVCRYPDPILDWERTQPKAVSFHPSLFPLPFTFTYPFLLYFTMCEPPITTEPLEPDHCEVNVSTTGHNLRPTPAIYSAKIPDFLPKNPSLVKLEETVAHSSTPPPPHRVTEHPAPLLLPPSGSNQLYLTILTSPTPSPPSMLANHYSPTRQFQKVIQRACFSWALWLRMLLEIS